MESNTYHLEENTHPLEVKQLIYTSLYEQGFTLLTSQNVPVFVQQSFTQKIIQTFWDPYLPPAPDYRAAYLYQMPPETTPGTLFGWLYHDGYDEIGRSDIPYFIAYYLPGLLQPMQLSNILTCLEHGPISWVDRLRPLKNSTLAPIVIEDIRYRDPFRQGVAIPTVLRVQSYEAMQSQVLIDYFVAHTPDSQPLVSPQSDPQPIPQLELSPQDRNNGHQRGELVMNSNNIEGILQDLISKPIGIHGAVLVSSEGLAMTSPMGIDENTSGMLAGSMIYLAQNTQKALNWQDVELISVKAPDGYIILSCCNADTYLLIQSKKVPIGLLESEIKQAVANIKIALNKVFNSVNNNVNTVIQEATQTQNYLPMESDSEDLLHMADLDIDHLDIDHLDINDLDINNLDIEDLDTTNLTDEVTYRGRKTST
jgi:predicted regulator of Ras-like GTPase activity (Roadblock/LC7/MglB family)